MIPKISLALIALCAGLQAQVTVANGASFRTDQPVTAGSWAVALGDFSGVSTQQAQALPLDTNLGGVSIKVDGNDSPIFYVSPTQVNFLIPEATTVGLKNVAITYSGGTINGTVQVANAGPGLFVDFSDSGEPISGRVINVEGGNAINGPSAPALRGQLISIYGTGPGTFDRPVTDGAAPGADPLANTVSTPDVLIGGHPAEVSFSGLNPLAPGLWQINVTIPADLAATGRVPLVVYSDGVDSNEVGIFVQ